MQVHGFYMTESRDDWDTASLPKNNGTLQQNISHDKGQSAENVLHGG